MIEYVASRRGYVYALVKPEDAAYFAGYVDGEGCITIGKVSPLAPSRAGRGSRSPSYTLEVHVANTCRTTLDQFQEIYGGSVIRDGYPGPGHKQVWTWRVSSALANEFLEDIVQYLRQKREQAQLALGFWEDRGKPPGGGRPLPPEELEKREHYYQEVRRLNAKGA